MFVQEPVTPEKLEAIALLKYIDELGRQVQSVAELGDGDAFIPRSPSPPPEYDKNGMRTNTREQRIRNALSIERTLAVRKALELIPDYVPPSDMKRLARIVEKYPIPVRDFPQINFVGLLLGPRGNALRRMETDSGARISIRGRGSVKEGSRSATAQQAQEEDLHCLVSATSCESIRKAFALIKQVIDTATQTPEHENDFKRLQLRELAELNGTLRDYENQLCTFCGEPGHRKFACPQREAALRDAVCRICGQQGHMMRDCDKYEAEKQHASSEPAGLHDFLNDLDNDLASDFAAATPAQHHSGNGHETDTNVGARPNSYDNDSTAVHRPVPTSLGNQNLPSPAARAAGQRLPETAQSNTASPGHPGTLEASSGPGTTSSSAVPPSITPPGVSPSSAAPPGVAPPAITPPGVAPSAIAPPGLAPPGIAPPGVAPPGIAPPGVAPPGVAPPGVAPPGITPPGIAPPGIAPPSIAPPGIAPPGIAPPPGFSAPGAVPPPGGISTKPAAPPPSAWKPPTWKPPTPS